MLNLTFVFVAARAVQGRIDKTLHGVDVENLLSNGVVRIGQYVPVQWLVKVAEISKTKKHLPFTSVRYLQ